MNLKRKLREWRAAEVINQETEDKILTFEARSKSGFILLYALGGLGALAVGIGIIAIVAANWELIPYPVKLANNILFAVILAFSIYWSDVHGRSWLKEIFLAIFYIYILGSISLIGQIYQLGIPIYQGFLIWAFCTVPVLLFGRRVFLAVLWVCGLTLTYGSSIEPLWLALSDNEVPDTRMALIYVWPLFLLIIGSIKTLKNSKPDYARSFTVFGIIGLLLLGSVSQQQWYANTGKEGIIEAALGMGTVLAFIGTVGFISALKYLYPNVSSRGIGVFKIILSFVFLTCFVPIIFPHEELGVVGAISFITLWCLTGWAALQFQMVKLFNFAVALVGLRILIVYFEIFGSLLSTGVGLITGGFFTLFLTWLWFKKSPRLREHLQQNQCSYP